MSNTARGFFDRKPERNLWDTPASRNKPGSLFDRKEQQYFVFALTTPRATFTNGVKPRDMRSEFQKRLDNDPFLGRNRNANVSTFNSNSTKQEIVKVEASPYFLDGLNIMNGCLDAAFLKADIGARIMKLPPSRFLRSAGGVTGSLGLLFNAYELYTNRNFNNYAKLGCGLVLLGLAAFGGSALVPLVIAGNIGMIAWDLGEGLYEHIKNKR
ncbi:MAG: hypothetical protein E6Q66_10055 [Pedobacter sp.]|nr:MAG: hypothetical protein E6Q66_10055 [Pedobacter sp.]